MPVYVCYLRSDHIHFACNDATQMLFLPQLLVPIKWHLKYVDQWSHSFSKPDNYFFCRNYWKSLDINKTLIVTNIYQLLLWSSISTPELTKTSHKFTPAIDKSSRRQAKKEKSFPKWFRPPSFPPDTSETEKPKFDIFLIFLSPLNPFEPLLFSDSLPFEVFYTFLIALPSTAGIKIQWKGRTCERKYGEWRRRSGNKTEN